MASTLYNEDNRMNEIEGNVRSSIEKQYWKRIPKERVDEAVMASKKKYSSHAYAGLLVAFLIQTSLFFYVLLTIDLRINDLVDRICAVGLLLLFLVYGLSIPGYLFLENKKTTHEIKTGKARIKSGKILKIQKNEFLSRKKGTKEIVFHFLCQDGHDQVIYEKGLFYKNATKVLPGQDVTVVLVNKELIILDQYYPEYAGKEGTVFVRDNPAMIQFMEHYGYNMMWDDLCQEIWDKYVPDKGKSNALQGELLRLTELLRTIAEENNEKWNAMCERACDFLEHYFVYDEKYSVSDKNKMQQIIYCIRKRGRNKELYENFVLFDYIDDEIAEIYMEEEKPIGYHYPEGRHEELYWEDEIEPQKTVVTSQKCNEKIVWWTFLVISTVLFALVFFVVGKNHLDTQVQKADSGIMLDVPVVQVDGNTMEVGENSRDIYAGGYDFMSENGRVYSGRNWFLMMIDSKESKNFYIVKERKNRKDFRSSYEKTGIEITVTNTEKRANSALTCKITKIVIDERENFCESVLTLDGIETQDLDRNAVVEELQLTGVKFDIEETKKFLNGEIDKLVSDSANYRYTIKASQDYRQVILEIEWLE